MMIYIRLCGVTAMTNWQIVDARNLGFYMTDEDKDGARFAECKAIPSVWKILKLIALLTAEERIVFPARGETDPEACHHAYAWEEKALYQRSGNGWSSLPMRISRKGLAQLVLDNMTEEPNFEGMYTIFRVEKNPRPREVKKLYKNAEETYER